MTGEPAKVLRAAHHDLSFWSWACLNDAQACRFLSQQSRSDNRVSHESVMLSCYHFIMVTGILLRVHKRTKGHFRAVDEAFDKSEHLLTEGKKLRDMLEHAYDDQGYLEGGGRHPEEFHRAQSGIVADATSLVVIGDRHWLGNRLCLESAIEELAHIHGAVRAIEPPIPF